MEKVLYIKIQSVQYEQLPQAVKEKAVMIWMHDLLLGQQFSNKYWSESVLQDGLQVDGHSGDGWLLLGQSKRTISTEESIQFNATAMASSVLEDYYGGLHLGPVIVPVLMYELEQIKKAGKQPDWKKLVEAIVAGYEIGLWLNEWFGEILAQKGFRSTPLFGAFAAIGAMAKIQNLSERDFRAALSLPGSAGFGASFPLLGGTEEWIFQAGWSARLAYQSVRFTRRMRFPNLNCLSGLHSLRHLLQEDNEVIRLIGEIDSNSYRIMNVGLKRHPVNVYVQSPVEAMSRAVRKKGKSAIFGAEEIEVLVPNQVWNMKMLHHMKPFTQPYQAVLSIPACVSMIANFGDFLFEDLKKANCHEVQELGGKVNVVGSDELREYDTVLILKSNGEVIHREGVRSSYYYPSLAQEREWLQSKGWDTAIEEELWISPILELLMAGR